MKRSAVGIEQVADVRQLAVAFYQAAQGKRHRSDVQAFAARLDHSLAVLRADILESRAPDGRHTVFTICDPKLRRIVAPCFRDRVLHHALVAHIGPVLERGLVEDTFACRVGKGTHGAVQRAQHHARRSPWVVKTDVRAFFASIQHATVGELLRRRFKDRRLLALCDRIIAAGGPGVGLPVGALTSQHFANAILDVLDRFLLERLRVRRMVRYMDDALWWCDSREQARESFRAARGFLATERGLVLKEPVIQRSERGVAFLGFRVLPGTLLLSRRRRRRYVAARARSERAWSLGLLDTRGLQAGYAAALAVTAGADACGFRRRELLRGTVDA